VGGVIRVGKTQMLPDLADVYAVIAYYLRHRTELDAYLKEREQEAQKMGEEIEQEFPPDGIRARLMARRNRERG
jgi:hypothetical protein